MIVLKSSRELELMKEACIISAQALQVAGEAVKPGVTGYWQAYARNNATYQSGERQKMEMYYVRNASLWLDIKILFKTVESVLKKSGAQ